MDNTVPLIITKPKHAGGRPTKYKDVYCEDIIDHMAKGLSIESYAGVIGVTKDTLYQWMKLHEEFSDAVDRGRAKCQLMWEKIGIAGSTGKLKGFNATSWQFNMQNRFKWKNREDHTSDDEKMATPHVIINTQ